MLESFYRYIEKFRRSRGRREGVLIAYASNIILMVSTLRRALGGHGRPECSQARLNTIRVFEQVDVG